MYVASFDYNIEMLSLGRLRLLNAVVTTLVLLCQYTVERTRIVSGSTIANHKMILPCFPSVRGNAIAPGITVQNMCVFDLVSVDKYVPFSLLRKIATWTRRTR